MDGSMNEKIQFTAGPISPERPRGPGGPVGPGRPVIPSLPGDPAAPDGPCKQQKERLLSYFPTTQPETVTQLNYKINALSTGF